MDQKIEYINGALNEINNIMTEKELNYDTKSSINE